MTIISLDTYRASRGRPHDGGPHTVTLDGVTYDRLPAGSGIGHDDGLCFECGAGRGALHALGCDVERCPDCLGQLVVCRRGAT
jgi:hypothetical protein